MSKPRIGFIGIGLMGAAMCNRLLDQGYVLTIVANRSRSRIDQLVGRGATEVSSARAVAEASDVVMLCMDTSASVEARVYGDEGVLQGLRTGAIVVDFGTSLPASTKKIANDMIAVGASYLDAPLGRTPAHALEGKLNIMCAGDKAAYSELEPVLADLGENIFHLGETGTGHTIKLINNFFAMTTVNAMSEAFAMADMAGVDRQSLYNVMSAGPLHSGMMDIIKAYAIDGDRNKLEFSAKNGRKDIGYYAKMAEDLGVESVMVNGARQSLGMAVAMGRGDNYVSQQLDFFLQIFGSAKADSRN